MLIGRLRSIEWKFPLLTSALVLAPTAVFVCAAYDQFRGPLVSRIVLTAAAIALLGTLLVWMVTRRITLRIANLTRDFDHLEPGGGPAPEEAEGTPDEIDRLCSAFERMVERVTSNQEHELERNAELKSSQLAILDLLSRAGEFRDDQTSNHTKRVGMMAARLARVTGAPEKEVELMSRAAPLHDIGKIGIPDQILLKPGALSEEERAMMKKHTVIGNAILQNDQSDLMKLAASIALNHHERWDGAGYPHGLSGEQIPIEARVVAIADVFDALTHDRPYRPAWTVRDAVRELSGNRGAQFDPTLLDSFLGKLDDILS